MNHAQALSAVSRLVATSDREMAGPTCADDADDEHVASCLVDGKVVPAGDITFGMIREAVSGIKVLQDTKETAT